MELTEDYKKEVVGPMKSKRVFVFGDGGRRRSEGKYIIPTDIIGQSRPLALDVVRADIPLLLSKFTRGKESSKKSIEKTGNKDSNTEDRGMKEEAIRRKRGSQKNHTRGREKPEKDKDRRTEESYLETLATPE